MSEKPQMLCEDEGCPHHGTTHVCVSQTTVPRSQEDIPWRRRGAYARAMSHYLNPTNPHAVTLADADRFMQTDKWARLYGAIEEFLRPEPGEALAVHVMALFEHMKREGTLHD